MSPITANLFIPAADMTPEEQQSFRDWAKANYKPLSPISGIWHPIVQAECVKINQEFSESTVFGDLSN